MTMLKLGHWVQLLLLWDYNQGGGGWERDSRVPPSSRNSKAIIANYNFDSPW